jgi:protein-S-isoprenylcysteine O-methyltransferase Ste14
VNALAGNLGRTKRAGWSGIARRIRVPLGFVFAAVYLWLAQPTVWSIAVGAVIALPGLGLRACASGHVRKNEELTTTGPYSYTRNPLYLGSIVIAAGFALASCNWIVDVILLVLLVVIYLPVIRSEEEFLRNKFADFNAYAAQVPRFWPRWSGGKLWYGFSSQLYRRHREYNAAIGTAAMLLALLLKWVWISRGVH